MSQALIDGLIPLPVSYATASAEAVASLLAAHYDLRGPLTCALLNRGFNDTYAVVTDAGALRVAPVRAPRPRPG